MLNFDEKFDLKLQYKYITQLLLMLVFDIRR